MMDKVYQIYVVCMYECMCIYNMYVCRVMTYEYEISTF